MINCSCGRSVSKQCMAKHLTTKIHEMGLAKQTESVENIKFEVVDTENISVSIGDDDDEEELDFGIDENDDFLGEFSNDTFQTEPTKDELLEIKKQSALLREKGKLETLKQRENNRFKKDIKKDKVIGEDDTDVFSNEGSEIFGLEKRTLLKKVQQYKFLFPKELKGFKIKKKATVIELKAYVQECETIVSLDGTEAFVLDGPYQAISVVEGVSSMTQDLDITGLSQMLKGNLQFQQLAKILFVKYNTFSRVAPEYQASFIVLTTAYICKMSNSQRKKTMRTQGQS